jgi:hypothetical protein
MSMMIRGALVAGILALALAFLAGPATGGGEKERWKKSISGDAFKQLVEDEAKIIQEKLKSKDEDDIKRAEFGAMMVAGYALSRDKADKNSNAVGGQAAALLKAIRTKGKIAEARKLADGLTKATDGKAPDKIDTGNLDVAEIMNPLKTKAKGGDGIHPDLQVNIRLKGTQNGIEEKIRNLAQKPMTDTNMTKTAKELALFAYRLAVLGEIVHEYAPKKGKNQWEGLSLEMRNTALELASAATKKNKESVFLASSKLNAACNNCHTEFRKK